MNMSKAKAKGASKPRPVKYSPEKPRPLPEAYPLFEVDDVDLAFPTASGYLHSGGRYLDYYEGQCALVPSEWKNRANELFAHGMKAINGFGMLPKEELGPMMEVGPKISRALGYLLGSWAPKHEEKEATVGFALMMWLRPMTEQEAEDYAEDDGTSEA